MGIIKAQAKNERGIFKKMSKVQIFGDSILQGVIFSDEANRYKIRKDKFATLAENGIEVENHSRMGATVKNILVSQERFITAENEADVVLLEIGGNDCDFNWKEVSDNPDGEHTPNTSPDEFVSLYSEAIERAQKGGKTVAIASLVPIDAEKYLNWISRGLSKENILRWLGDVSMLSRWHEYYNHLVESLAAKFGCKLIDLRDEFLCRHDYKTLICTDGIHPTQAGYDVIEKILAREICAAV